MNKCKQIIADHESTIQELEARLLTTDASESACRRELDALQVKLNKDVESHDKATTDLKDKVDKLKREISEIKV